MQEEPQYSRQTCSKDVLWTIITIIVYIYRNVQLINPTWEISQYRNVYENLYTWTKTSKQRNDKKIQLNIFF